MKIIYFTDTFLPQINGVVTSILNFSRELAKRGHRIYIFSARNGKEKKTNLGRNIEVKYFHAGRLVVDYPDLKIAYPNALKTFNEVRKIKPDIIHTHTPSPQAWVALVLSHRLKIPTLSTYHTLLPDFIKHARFSFLKTANAGKYLAWEYSRRYYNSLDAVVTPSLAMKKELKKNGIKKPIYPISNGIDLKKFYPLKRSHQGIKLLYLGRVSYEKNIDQVLEAFKLCLDNKLSASLSVVGDGPDLKKMKETAQKLDLKKQVEFLGVINHEKLRKVYNGHDIFITASTVETEGLVILEAMACGLPIIGVKKLAVPDIVKHNKNGLIARPGNIKEMAGCLKELILSKSKRERFGRASIEESKNYNLKSSIDKIEAIYAKLKKKNN